MASCIDWAPLHTQNQSCLCNDKRYYVKEVLSVYPLSYQKSEVKKSMFPWLLWLEEFRKLMTTEMTKVFAK